LEKWKQSASNQFAIFNYGRYRYDESPLQNSLGFMDSDGIDASGAAIICTDFRASIQIDSGIER